MTESALYKILSCYFKLLKTQKTYFYSFVLALIFLVFLSRNFQIICEQNSTIVLCVLYVLTYVVGAFLYFYCLKNDHLTAKTYEFILLLVKVFLVMLIFLNLNFYNQMRF